MTFNSNLPLPSDKIRNFPGNVTTNNWPRLVANINADHNFQNTAGGVPDTTGFHKIIHFITQSVDPSTVTNTGQFYTEKLNNVMVLKFFNDLGNDYHIFSNLLKNNVANGGWTSTFGAFTFQWGNIVISDTIGHTFNLPVAFNNLTPYAVFCQPINTHLSSPVVNIALLTNDGTHSQFQYRATSTDISSFYYLAIGQ